MKSITQKDDFGCGAACVALVTGKTYKEVVNVLGETKVKKIGFYLKELIEGLEKLKFTYNYKYLKPKLMKKIYQDGVIVFVKRSKKYPAGHYLVRQNNLWMDPWINFVQSKDLKEAKSGFRKRLPSKAVYGLFPS